MVTRHRTALAVLTAVALGAASCARERDARGEVPAATPEARPSILLISIDTTRADRLGAYGFSPSVTPNIDAWAAEGVVFDNATTPVPITLPAHTSMLTGLFPYRHGARDNGIYRVPEDVPTVASQLAEGGYDTGAVVAAAVLDRQYGLARGFGHYDDGGRDAVAAAGGLAIAERDARAVTDAAIRAAAALVQPYFLFVHYFDPHAGYRPPAPFAERYRSSPYLGEIAYVDDQIGRLRRELESRGLMSDTVVVITSDHGEGLGEHDEVTHGVFLYQSTLHVPLIVVAPGRWPSGRRVAELVSLTDIAPTLYRLSGIDPPDRPYSVDGLALDPDEPERTRWIPLESEFGLNSYGWAPLVGITDGRMKWIGAPRRELYDLSVDPGEARNLAASRDDEMARLESIHRETTSEDRRVAAMDEADDEASSRRLAELRSLGYVAGSPATGSDRSKLVDPKDAIASLDSINRARQLMSEGRPRDAATLLGDVIEISPRNTSALVLSGAAHLMNGNPESALVSLEKAERVAPLNADVHFNLGLAWLGTGRPDDAASAWRRALELAPRHQQATINLTDLLIRANRPDEAETVLSAARARDLSGAIFDYLEGKIAILKGDRDRARERLNRALSGSLPQPVADDARALLTAIEN